MNELNSLLSALELTGGERIVLRSEQIPQLIVGDTRHDLATAAASTTAALERLADLILSPAGKKALTEQRVAVEPLPEHQSQIPVRVMVRRIGPHISVELQRDAEPSDTSEASMPPTSTVTSGLPVARLLVSSPELRARRSPTPAAKDAASSSGRIQREAPRQLVDALKRPVSRGPIDDLIDRALQRSATAIYFRGGHVPVARVGARMERLGTQTVDSSIIETAVATFAPGVHLGSTPPAVWVRDYPGVRQRWHAFTDGRGPGLVIDLGWRSAEAILQRDLPRRVKRICEEDDGVVVVAGSASADAREIIAAVGTWTASRRAGYVISIEPPNGLEHGITGTFMSARRIDGLDKDGSSAIRRAADEAPDVLIVMLSSGMSGEEAIRAARPGCLVILGVVAPTAARAIESLLAGVAPRHESELRQSLAARFRCAFSYRALHTASGRRIIVHDLLVATSDVRERLEQWDIGALDKFQRSGTDGMHSLDAALAAAAASGEISVRQAAFNAVDRQEVVRMIRRTARERRGARARLPSES